MVGLWACAEAPPAGSVAAPSAELDGQQVVFVGEEVELDAGESHGDTFSWDFGDGSTGEGTSVTHVYAAPGRYTLRLTARATDGRTDIASATRVAVWEPLATPPTASGRLATIDGVLYAALPEAGVAVVTDGAVSWLDTCGEPTAVSAANGRLAVACREDAVQFWEGATLTHEFAFRWGARPEAVAMEPGGDAAYVALAGTGEVVRIGAEGTTAVATLADARGLAAGPGGPWVARFRSPDDGGRVLGPSGELALLPDAGPDSDTDARGVPTLLGAVALRPDGREVIVAGTKANTARGLRRDGLPYTHETATRAALRAIDVAGGTSRRALFDNRDRVGAVAFSPLGDQLYVAHHGAGIVDVLDPVSLERIGGWQSVGVGLDGLAADGEALWVLASIDRELIAFDLSAGNEEIELARIPLGSPDPGARIFHFAADPRMSADAYLSCASCHPDGGADGRVWDFSDREEGFRETQALFAMPAEGPWHWSANFDELQDFEGAIRAHQAGTGFMTDEQFAVCSDPWGEPTSGRSEDLDDLAEYVRSFAGKAPRSPWRDEDGTATEAGARGAQAFVAKGCDSCHAGEEYTDGAQHDVGTIVETSGERLGEALTGIRTPGLRGLHATAPYLHDGRAATVQEALVAHGLAADPDLVSFLLELE